MGATDGGNGMSISDAGETLGKEHPIKIVWARDCEGGPILVAFDLRKPQAPIITAMYKPDVLAEHLK